MKNQFVKIPSSNENEIYLVNVDQISYIYFDGNNLQIKLNNEYLIYTEGITVENVKFFLNKFL